MLGNELDELGDDVESDIRVGSDETSEEREDGFERDSGEEGRSSDGVDLGENLAFDGGLGSGLDLEEEDEDVESEREVVEIGVDDEGLKFEDEFRRNRLRDGASEPENETMKTRSVRRREKGDR